MTPQATPDQPRSTAPTAANAPPCTETTAQGAPAKDGADGAAPAGRRGRPSLEEAQRIPERILEAGWEVLRDHGFDAFTFDRVARHARIGKATIYARFPGKREFLEALLAHKATQRQVTILAVGRGMPIIEAFCKRAIVVIETLVSSEGIMMERLVDWCDQEFGDHTINYRRAMFADALAKIEAELRSAAAQDGLDLGDFGRVAQFWMEGLLGHARLIAADRAYDHAKTERWAKSYSEFFFSRLGA